MSSMGSWMDETETSTLGQDLWYTQGTLSWESIFFRQFLNAFPGKLFQAMSPNPTLPSYRLPDCSD